MGDGRENGRAAAAQALHVDPPEVARLRAQTEALARLVAQLQHALEARVVIEQAKGVLAERLDLPVEEAFAVLRAAARSHRINIHELAARVVSSRTSPPEVGAQVRRLQ